MKIRQKLILAFISIALLVVIVGYISVNASQKSLQKTIGENSLLLARETLDKVDRNIYHRIEHMQAYSKDLMFRKAIVESNQEFEELDNIQEYIDKRDKEWVSAPKGKPTPFIQEVISNELLEELKMQIEFYEERHEHTIFPEVYVTNKYGVVIASTGRTSDYLQADEEWYQKAVAEKEFWVGKVEYDERKFNEKNKNLKTTCC